jgi:hypothetical protein
MKNRTYHIFAAAVVFGILVWLSVTLREQYQITVTVPLRLEGIPRGFAVRTQVPPSVDLQYRGDGWRLMLLMLGSKGPLVLPILGVVPPAAGGFDSTGRLQAFAEAERVFAVHDLARQAAAPPGVQLVGVTPESLAVGLDRYEERRVPVTLDLGLAFREGYGQVGSPMIVPDSVTIGGASGVVRRLDSWPTVRENVENVRMPLETDLSLARSPQYEITVSPSRVHVSINVQPFAEKTISGITVAVMDVPADREVILIPPKIEIVARAGIKQLSTLTSGEFKVSVAYDRILRDSTGTVDPAVAGPQGIQVVSRRPERLQYIVRKRL